MFKALLGSGYRWWDLAGGEGHTTDGQHLPEYQTAADQRLQKRNSRAPGYPAGDKAKCPLRSPIGSDAVAIFAEAGRRKPHTRSTSATMRGSPGSSLSTVTVIVHWSSLSACLACFPRDQIFSTAWSLGRSHGNVENEKHLIITKGFTRTM
ncbi:hypothetical protein CKAH01_00528 [Colletotrichum kahawae]|uniref:Uncharacterized protein n=1 Tax=Colletotrichum kahawae TaxID=34407 RepID=A0AAE0D8P0_COLKA|nr:hypothetical protein CKAH01_00528 [Colletotrichum kahawae]